MCHWEVATVVGPAFYLQSSRTHIAAKTINKSDNLTVDYYILQFSSKLQYTSFQNVIGMSHSALIE
jgi:hypothetical protein